MLLRVIYIFLFLFFRITPDRFWSIRTEIEKEFPDESGVSFGSLVPQMQKLF